MDGQPKILDRSPELFPYSLDAQSDSVSFIRLDRADYERASFLDARILTPRANPHPMPWPRVAASIESAGLAERCGYLFHIGHVGSTLLSRLIGAHPQAFALREPMILRQLAQHQGESAARPGAWTEPEFDARVEGCVKLLSRTFAAQQRAVVKATSFVSELAQRLMSRPAAPAAAMMFVSPETYLATILGGPNSRQEAKVLTRSRLRRLHRRIGHDAWRLESFSEGEALALGWACEAAALAEAALTAGGRILRIDFDRFLADPAALLQSTLRHFDIDATTSDVNAILEGPDMIRYSKAPEYAYDAALRREILDQARADHGAEIKRGLDWLERAVAQFAPVAQAVSFALPG